MLERLEMVKVRQAELLHESEIVRRAHGAPKQRRVPGTQVLRAAGRRFMSAVTDQGAIAVPLAEVRAELQAERDRHDATLSQLDERLAQLIAGKATWRPLTKRAP